jgi:hypothetical protein
MNTAKVDGCNEVAFSLTRGLNWLWTVTVTDAKKKIQPLVNYTAKMEIRSIPVYPQTQGALLYRLSSTPTAGQGTITITQYIGKLALNIPIADSLLFAEGCYIYDLVITSPALENYQIIKGNFTVTSTVTTI